MKLTNKSVINILKQKHGFNFSRSLGQNFIVNPSICPKIAELGGCHDKVGVLEIGVGIGVLTKELATLSKKVVAVEIDKTLAPILEETLSDFDNIKIIYDDITKIHLKDFFEKEFQGMEVVCCANLPYYITSPIIMKLLEEELPLKSITVMVQREAAIRITAIPGTRECGSISAAVRYYGIPEKLFNVSKGSFFPIPRVDSTVIKININTSSKLTPKEKKLFFKIIKSVFSKRRKQIINPLSEDLNIPKDIIAKLLSGCNIKTSARAEELSMDDFFNINKKIGEYYENISN